MAGFAERLRGTERLSPRAGLAVRYPALFAFIGPPDEAYGHIRAFAEEAMPGAAFFLDLFGEGKADDNSEQAARDVKLTIQRNDAGLNVKRVDINAVICAHTENSGLIKQAGVLCKEVFGEDFPVTHTALYILLYESDGRADYERRLAAACRTLNAASDVARDTLYDSSFILSDRSEHGVVGAENTLNNCRLIAHMPFLFGSEYRFEDNPRVKSGFSTAGFARLEKPLTDIARAVYAHVFDCWLSALKQTTSQTAPPETLGALLAIPDAPDGESFIKRGIAGAAAKPVRPWRLLNKTVYEAERLIYGDGAERFFGANCNAERFYRLSEAREIIERFCSQSPGDIRGGPGGTDYRVWETQAGQIEQEAEALYRKPVGGLFAAGYLNAAKKKITDVYLLKYRAARLRYAANAAKTAAALAEDYNRRRSAAFKKLDETHRDLISGGGGQNRLAAFYRQVVNNIMGELTARHGEGFILKDEFIGVSAAFANEPDFQTLAVKLEDFITRFIYTHESMRLSFDEDLKQRAQLAFDAHDGAAAQSGEFYRNILAEADKQAALAVSLQNDDGLIREKCYFGDADSELMRYARETRAESVGESVCFADDASGFKLIRLAGGFAAENLLRWRVMERCYNKIYQNTKG